MDVLMRYAASAITAVSATFGLFLFMQHLVVTQDGELKPVVSGGMIDFVRVRHDTPVQTKPRELPKRPETPDEPPPPQVDHSAPDVGATNIMPIAMPTASAGLKLRGGPKLGAAPSRDGTAIPLVRIQPEYPRLARQNRTEGWVRVRFDISPTGRVENPVVIASQPAGVFETATIRAFKRWKYRPKVVNGTAVAQRNQVTRIVFKLD